MSNQYTSPTTEQVKELLTKTKRILTLDEIARALGKSKAAISSALYRLELPDDMKLFSTVVTLDGTKGYIIERKVQKKVIDLKPLRYSYREDQSTPYFQFYIEEDKEDKVSIIPLSDVHYGQQASEVDKLARLINWIQEKKNRYVVVLGDMIECATKSSVGDGVYVQTLSPQKQAEEIIKILTPIRDRILYLSMGNHEYRSLKGVGVDLMYWIAETLKVPYRPFQVYSDIWINEDVMFEMWTNHGSTSAITDGGKINYAKRPMSYMFQQPHFITIAHVHDIHVKKVMTWKKNRRLGTLEQHKTYVETTGGFLGYFNTYVDMKGYPPTAQGTIRNDLYLSGDYHASV